MASVNPDFKGMDFPSDHQFVIIDTSSNLPKYKQLAHIPMSFWIDYKRVDNRPSPPPLSLLINPENMVLTFNKKISTNFTRGGYVVEEWGEELDVMTCEGKIGGYYITTSSVKNSPHALNGLNRYNRSKSLSFKNLYKLLYIYRNNGAIYQNTVRDKKENKLIQRSGYPYINKRAPLVLENPKNRMDRIGDVFIQYDNTEYLGAFDSFSITEDANSPYTLSYKFQFTIQRRTVKDYRDYNFHMASATENSDVSKNREQVSRVVLNAISVEKNAAVGEKANLNGEVTTANNGIQVTPTAPIVHTTEEDIPVPVGSLKPSTSSDKVAFKAKEMMYKRFVAMSTEEVASLKEGYDQIAIAKDTKIAGQERLGKDKVRKTLYESALRNGKGEREAASIANSVTQNSTNELAPRTNLAFDSTIDDITGGSNV